MLTNIHKCYNPSICEAEVGGLLQVCSQSGIHSKILSEEKTKGVGSISDFPVKDAKPVNVARGPRKFKVL